jgi:hypothetical protein
VSVEVVNCMGMASSELTSLKSITVGSMVVPPAEFSLENL